ncbi:MAG: phospholipid carrier-dependent glycosyltransferase [Planctomycetota bacterium]|nr:MAG: phospholipid carrier-dependent glycosyltransferase [Planctomycetota bacterium]
MRFPASRWLPWLFWLLAAAAALLRPLAEPDEGRYGEVAREMLAGGDFLLPRLNDVVYPDKPPGAHWLMAAGMAVLGPGALAVRLPALLAFAALLALVARQARAGPPGFAAAAVLVTASSPLLWFLGQLATLDLVLTACESAAILCAWRWLHGAPSWTAAAAGVALGYGFLVKGPVAWALPLLILAAAALWERRGRALGRLLHPALWAPMLAVGLPWYVLAWRADPALLGFWVFRETLDRVSSATHARTQPLWYFPALALAATFPWWLPAGAARLRGRKPPADQRHPDARLHLVWAWLPVVVFSLPASKQPGYLAPAIPGFALWLAGWWHERAPLRRRHLVGALLLLGYAALLLLVRDPERARSDDPFARALRAAGAERWNGVQLMGWSYGLGFRLQRDDLVAAGPIPPAWRYAEQQGRVRAPRALAGRYALSFEVLSRDADGDGAPDPGFVLLHQLEDEPQHFHDFPEYCRARGLGLHLWLRTGDAALFSNRPP